MFRPRSAAVSVALTAALGLAGLSACGSSEQAAGDGGAKMGRPDGQAAPADTNTGLTRYAPSERKAAPKLEGTTLEDQKFALTAQKGKVVVVNFWGSWCPPCRAEAPALTQTYEAMKGKGVTFVGVDQRDNKAAARAYQKTYDVTYPSVFDDDGSIAALWPSALGPPYTFVIDKQGRVAARFLGGTTADELQSEVLSVAGEA